MKQWLIRLRQYLLTGVSYAVPFIACGGILIAVAIAFAPMKQGTKKEKGGPDFSNAPNLKLIHDIGATSFGLMLPVLAGYIAYAIASKPGLVPGFVGGFLCGRIPNGPADPVSAGFLGALVAGLIAGYIVHFIKQVPVSKHIRPIMPILVIPIISSLAIGFLVLFVFGPPIAQFFAFLTGWLKTMSGGSAVVLAMVIGAMIAFDMGGPVNKAAFFFGSGLIQDDNTLVMGMCAAAICTPPLGLGLATLLARTRWTEEERESGIAALGMGMIGITEGAIPFAAADPLRVIPCIMLGSAVASVIACLGGVGDHAPHGGPIVLPVVDHRFMYIVAIAAGTVVTALSILFLKSLTRQPRPALAEAAA